MGNWTVADYTNDDGITWVFDADGRTVAGAYSREVAELIAKAPGLLACAEHYAARDSWKGYGTIYDGHGERGDSVACEALKGEQS